MVESPPVTVFTCHVTPVFVVALNVAVNCSVRPVYTEADVGEIVSAKAVPDVIVIVAVANWVVSATDVAVIVTVAGLGTTAGAA